jgi:hypothetical protein
MKYILQLDGSYFGVLETSEYYKRVSLLSKDQHSVVFCTESSAKVQKYLKSQKQQKKK